MKKFYAGIFSTIIAVSFATAAIASSQGTTSVPPVSKPTAATEQPAPAPAPAPAPKPEENPAPGK